MLGTRLELFRSPKYKELRRQLHPLIEEHIKRNSLTTGDNSEARYIKSLNARIGGALMDGRLEDSL